ncbi:MAG: sigma-70 family RNA polymerase sigma factor [Planctomycetaceae bacterium]|nr:sigma-70 family RNA polymerase sigma factor [Planctomycetaceae bacterium]
MRFAPETRQSLMIRLSDADDAAAWEEFVALYRPVIIRLARFRGLQQADAEDLAQQALVAVAAKIPQWQTDRDRGRFRTWLSRVVRNIAVNMLTRHREERGCGGTSAVKLINGRPADEQCDEEILETEWRREALRRAADQVRSEFQTETWEAFLLTALDGISVAEASARIGRSAGAVYVARSRIMKRLQEKVRQMSGEIEGSPQW